MDDKEKQDTRAEIRLQPSDAKQELSQPTESDTNRDRIDSTNCELSADIPTCCTDGYRISQNITFEHVPPLSTHENSKNTSPATTSTQDSIEVKTEMKSDYDGYGGNTTLTRHCVTCPGGILKEVKAERTPNISEILPLGDGSENVDEKPIIDTHNGKLHERTHTSMKPFTCDILCGK